MVVHPRKLITTGEGGMLTTDSAERGSRDERLREHGMSVSAAGRHLGGAVVEDCPGTGSNCRMTDIRAALGPVQLSTLDSTVRRRREPSARYHEPRADGVDARGAARGARPGARHGEPPVLPGHTAGRGRGVAQRSPGLLVDELRSALRVTLTTRQHRPPHHLIAPGCHHR